MNRFVEGEDRRQGALLPHCLDDYVTENNPVRVIEAFIDELDLAPLGFDDVVPETTTPGLPSSDAIEDLSLRLSQPRAVEPAARTGSAAQYRADVADRAAGRSPNSARQWRGDPRGVCPVCGVVPRAGPVRGEQLLFHPISRLYQRTSIILTTNLARRMAKRLWRRQNDHGPPGPLTNGWSRRSPNPSPILRAPGEPPATLSGMLPQPVSPRRIRTGGQISTTCTSAVSGETSNAA